MKMLLSSVAIACLLLGCRSRPITPDQSWADYSQYYAPSGEQVAPYAGVVDVRMAKVKEADAQFVALKNQGKVLIGTFKIADDTDISRAAVEALARKLNADTVVWSNMRTLVKTAMPNPDMGIVGVDKTQMAQMNANRPDQAFADQVLETHHTIWMFGTKTAK